MIFLLTALGGSEPQPFAAVIAALLGWLTIYTYMLQAECLRLTTTLQSLENRRGELRDQERVDLEMSHIYNAYESMITCAFRMPCGSMPKGSARLLRWECIGT